MKKSHYVYALFSRYFLNFSERLAQVLLYRKPFPGLTLEADLSYGNRKHETVDFIYPIEKTQKKLPIMIYIHGGGWLSGIKNMRRTYCYEYAKEGYFVANIDYDWSPEYQFPYQIQQCLNAVDFILDNSDRYNLDCTKILLAGESAGAYFVAMLAAISKNKKVLKTLDLDFKHVDTFNVSVNLFNCGAFDIRSMAGGKFPNIGIMLESFTNLTRKQILAKENFEKVDLMTPLSYIDKDFPPTYFLYATHDYLRYDTFSAKNTFDKMGIPNDIYKCDGILYGNHAFAVATVTKKGQTILKATQRFVNGYIFD